MNNIFYTVKCITNLHMGSGDINFDVIDNQVQRDPITGYPSMFSSGIKGALRENFEARDNKYTSLIFGSPVEISIEDNNKKSCPGSLKFLNGNILLLSVRAGAGSKPFYMVTTKEILKCLGNLYLSVNGKELYEGFLKEVSSLEDSYSYSFESNSVKLGGKEYKSQEKINGNVKNFLEKVAGNLKDNILIIPDEDFKKLKLPVLARNNLENGVSNNLWYEEVVPHDSIFYFAVLSNGTKTGDEALGFFKENINSSPLVQFGGNSTIGYGLTELSEVKNG